MATAVQEAESKSDLSCLLKLEGWRSNKQRQQTRY